MRIETRQLWPWHWVTLVTVETVRPWHWYVNWLCARPWYPWELVILDGDYDWWDRLRFGR